MRPVRTHFDGGNYLFVKRILNLTIEQLCLPLPCLADKVSLPNTFSDVNEYYKGFEDLIVEDARASLDASRDKNDGEVLRLFVHESYRPSLNRGNPAPILF